MERQSRYPAVVVLAVILTVPFAASQSAGAVSKACKVPKGAVSYGTWRVTIKSFTRDGSKIIKPPAGRVTMAMDVAVSNTKGGDAPGEFLDINLIPTGARLYRGTVMRGIEGAAKSPKANEKIEYTLVFPVEIKHKDKPLMVQLDDFSGAIADEKLVPVC